MSRRTLRVEVTLTWRQDVEVDLGPEDGPRDARVLVARAIGQSPEVCRALAEVVTAGPMRPRVDAVVVGEVFPDGDVYP